MKVSTIKVYPVKNQSLDDLYLSIKDTLEIHEAKHYLTTRVTIELNTVDNYVKIKSLNLEYNAN